jgi:ferredoxin-NADP reductase/MOSC domain-containing protein YiiM
VATLVSVNVGLPRDVSWRGYTVHTGIWKQSVPGRSMVRRLNIDGDGQGDLGGHGGEHRAVMVYQLDSYRYWEAQLRRSDFTYGQFGENFTVEGLPDNEVSIGDRYRIGTALFEVTQPRVTCYRVGIRMDEPTMASLLVSHHRPGFYFRVLEEGEVGAGDEITKVAEDRERITVSEIDGLLYLPGHPGDKLERALRISALSPGWKSSLQLLIDQQSAGRSSAGNAGLTGAAAPPPAWPGFRQLRIAGIDRESRSVISLSFEDAGRSPLPAALPGQFLVLRLPVNPDSPPILRNYSMSGAPGAANYRISVKQEIGGVGSAFLHNRCALGDILEVSAPRGSFTLQSGDGSVVLLSAGIGATPVLAMLHHLAASPSRREVWWLHGAHDREDHSFAEESRSLVRKLPSAHSHIAYSRPGPDDGLGRDYDSAGRLSAATLDQLSVPRESDFYICGPSSFLDTFVAGLKARGVTGEHIHTEIFGPSAAITPGIAAATRGPVHPPSGPSGPGPRVSFARSGLAVQWSPAFQSLLELAEACDVPVKWACRTGVCHTCESALIGGAVVYQPDPLEPPAEGNVLICCSQPGSDLEIDL